MMLGDLPFSTMRVIAIAFGLLWGSFLNVVIYRVPNEMSVVHPGSRCPACGKPIAAYDNIPVLSYLILRGKARCCGVKMSPRYPIVEMLGGLLSWAVLEFIIFKMPATTSLVHVSAVYLSTYALTMGLLAAAFIDWEHMFLPDSITIGGAVLGVLTAPLRGMNIAWSIGYALFGFLVVWLPFIFLYKRLRGFEGMGLGDAKLLMLAGAWFGWIGVLFVLFAGAMQGVVGAIILYLVKGKIEDPESVKEDLEELRRAAEEGDEEAQKILDDDPIGATRDDGTSAPRIAFGPFLIFSIFEWLFVGHAIRSIAAAFYAD